MSLNLDCRLDFSAEHLKAQCTSFTLDSRNQNVSRQCNFQAEVIPTCCLNCKSLPYAIPFTFTTWNHLGYLCQNCLPAKNLDFQTLANSLYLTFQSGWFWLPSIQHAKKWCAICYKCIPVPVSPASVSGPTIHKGSGQRTEQFQSLPLPSPPPQKYRYFCQLSQTLNPSTAPIPLQATTVTRLLTHNQAASPPNPFTSPRITFSAALASLPDCTHCL